MLKLSSTAALAVFALFLVGCASQTGKTLVTYGRGVSDIPAPVQADKAGTYSVWAADAVTPVTSVKLDAGDTYGFRAEAKTGDVVAFFKTATREQEIPLKEWIATSFSWKYQKSAK